MTSSNPTFPCGLQVFVLLFLINIVANRLLKPLEPDSIVRKLCAFQFEEGLFSPAVSRLALTPVFFNSSTVSAQNWVPGPVPGRLTKVL